MDDTTARARVFWTGGSQAVRLPKAMRFRGSEVVLTKRGSAVLVEPAAEDDGWDTLWARLVPLKDPVRRWPTARVEKRRAL